MTSRPKVGSVHSTASTTAASDAHGEVSRFLVASAAAATVGGVDRRRACVTGGGGVVAHRASEARSCRML